LETERGPRIPKRRQKSFACNGHRTTIPLPYRNEEEEKIICSLYVSEQTRLTKPEYKETKKRALNASVSWKEIFQY
jgi:hypothetical protein